MHTWIEDEQTGKESWQGLWTARWDLSLTSLLTNPLHLPLFIYALTFQKDKNSFLIIRHTEQYTRPCFASRQNPYIVLTENKSLWTPLHAKTSFLLHKYNNQENWQTAVAKVEQGNGCLAHLTHPRLVAVSWTHRLLKCNFIQWIKRGRNFR